MKLQPRDAAGFFARPDLSRPACLIYGQDAMRVSLKRTDLVQAAGGPQAEEDMRITRLDAADLRKDPAALTDAAKAVGFFPGPRVVVVEGLTDQHLSAVTTVLAEWRDGDAFLVLTAGALKPSSKLRKLLESHDRALITAVYDDPPSRAEIEATLAKAGLTNIGTNAMVDLVALAQVLDPGDLRQFAEKLAVYKLGDDTPLSPEELAALAPQTIDAAVDDAVHAAAEGRTSDIGPLMQRLRGQGVPAVQLAITAGRHFRTLHQAACDPGGPAAGIGRVRPPVYGPRRDRMTRQAQNWGKAKLETALEAIVDVDLTLRSAGQVAPDMALVERTLVRLAMLCRN